MKREVIDRVGQILRETAAAVVMPRFASLVPLHTEMKAANEPVTIADREAETLISRELLALVAGSRVIGEEACSANPGLLDGLSTGTAWIVDPIDGTANFAAGRAPFAMMVALIRDGEAIGSWIYDPMTDRLAVAERGAGAFLNGQRISSGTAPATPADWHGIVSQAFLPDDQKAVLDRLTSAVGRVDPTLRCAGHEYPLVATAERQFALYWRTLVWDHAPGALLLTEAGGTVTHLDGSNYSPAVSRSGLLLAQNSCVSSQLLSFINVPPPAKGASPSC